MLSPGQQVGKYRVLSSIGAGGMGEVFLAEDVELERRVALKILPSEFAHSSDRVQRFIWEAKAASALNHPNILTIYEIGSFQETRFIASEYVDGTTLREILKSRSFRSIEVIEIALQIGSALRIAHSSKIVHRDIKPENIMLRTDNLVKVLDFGLAKLTEQKQPPPESEAATRQNRLTKAGLVLGTVAYMSPEQARGKPIDPRTDIFSFGTVLYEMLTRRTPFTGETNNDVIAAILLKEPVGLQQLNPDVPAALERVVLKALSKDVDGRYQTVGELLMDLEMVQESLTGKGGFAGLDSFKDDVEAKTEIIEANTGKNVFQATDQNSPELNTARSFFASVYRPELITNRRLWLIPLIFVVVLISYFGISTPKSKEPKPEALRLFNSGTESLRAGTFLKASKMLEDAVAADGSFSKARAGLAEAWVELDYFGRAQNEMLKVNELERNSRSFFSSFFENDDSLYIDAINATVRRDFPEAIMKYDRLVKRNPSEAHLYVDLGRAFEKNEEIDKAVECYEKAVEINSQYGAAFLRLGIIFSRKTEYPRSVDAFKKAEAIFERQSNDEGVAEVAYQMGWSQNAQENLSAARSQFEAVINNPRANKSQQVRALLQISSLCSGEGKTACAEEYATNAIRLAKAERMENVATNGLIDLGNSFLARGDYEKAEVQFQQALAFARQDEGLRNEARALLALGSLRIQQKKPIEARDFANQAIPFFEKGSYNKEIFTAYLILGRASEMNEAYEEALTAFQQVEDSPKASDADKAYAKMLSGNVLLQQEKFSEAVRRFEQSDQIYRNLNNKFYSTYIQFYLSDVLLHLGRFEEASDKLKNAEELLGEGDSLIGTLRVKQKILSAAVALSKEDLKLAISEVQKAEAPKETWESFDANLIVCLARIRSGGKSMAPECEAARQFAESKKDSRKLNIVKLALSESSTLLGDPGRGLQLAVEARDYFSGRGRLESTWRALLLCAAASEKLGDYENSRLNGAKAKEVLSRFEQELGAENYQSYISRPDRASAFQKAESLAK